MGQVHDVPLEKFINNINPFKKHMANVTKASLESRLSCRLRAHGDSYVSPATGLNAAVF